MSTVGGKERHIDWSAPTGSPDWLFGTGATRTERAVVWLTVAVAAVPITLVAQQRDTAWSWWQMLLVGALAVDLVGGVVANSLGSAKRLYGAEPSTPTTRGGRLLRNHVLFTAAHVHPFVVALLFPGSHWGWATCWYAVALTGVASVRALPVHLQRPVGMAFATLSAVAAFGLGGPAGLEWVGPVLVLKLVVAHAVTEAPFRPATANSGRTVTG